MISKLTLSPKYKKIVNAELVYLKLINNNSFILNLNIKFNRFRGTENSNLKKSHKKLTFKLNNTIS